MPRTPDLKKAGCSIERYNYIKNQPNEPIKRYHQQKAGAKGRHIKWEFTLSSWWDMWEKSGKWLQRGNQYGQYVMTRKKDRGPYSPGNVVIKTINENSSEFQTGKLKDVIYPKTNEDIRAIGHALRMNPVKYAEFMGYKYDTFKRYMNGSLPIPKYLAKSLIFAQIIKIESSFHLTDRYLVPIINT